MSKKETTTTKKRRYSVRRGEGWDFIETGLATLIRRMATDMRPLKEFELIYETIAFVRRYKEEKSTATIATNLEKKHN